MTRALFRAIATPLFRFRVEGAENVPQTGAAVLVATHRSWLDPACMGAACPRPIRFLMMDRVYRLWWAHWFFRGARTVPVDTSGAASIVGLRRAMRLLRAGELIGVFPEGRVANEASPLPLRPGAALLAVRGRAPVIPVAIHGAARAWPHGRRWPGPARVAVRIGPPLHPEAAGDRSAIERLLQRIGEALRKLEAEAP
jgi:1-acyl-sn-glycerol-3-phosphate acyltransferase